MKLNNRESIYGFCAWLTSRKSVVKMGSNEDCSPIPELIEEFSKVNELDEVSEIWPKNLVHPSGECSHIND